MTTGGTIDKIYFDAKSDYQVGPPNIVKILDELALSLEYQVTSLMRKDSLEITDSDRQMIVAAVRDADESLIVVTHGTDTMVETARALSGIPGKSIVLTGALEPAAFKTSDALFNIGGALAAVQVVSPGAYIAMNGRVFPHNRVRKNLELNRFVDAYPH